MSVIVHSSQSHVHSSTMSDPWVLWRQSNFFNCQIHCFQEIRYENNRKRNESWVRPMRYDSWWDKSDPLDKWDFVFYLKCCFVCVNRSERSGRQCVGSDGERNYSWPWKTQPVTRHPILGRAFVATPIGLGSQFMTREIRPIGHVPDTSKYVDKDFSIDLN